jgi:hypothetical protein
MAYNTTTAMPSASSGKRGANFPKSQNGTSVRVSPGKGGQNLGTPRHCESKRAASNLKNVYANVS